MFAKQVGERQGTGVIFRQSVESLRREEKGRTLSRLLAAGAAELLGRREYKRPSK